MKLKMDNLMIASGLLLLCLNAVADLPAPEVNLPEDITLPDVHSVYIEDMGDSRYDGGVISIPSVDEPSTGNPVDVITTTPNEGLYSDTKSKLIIVSSPKTDDSKQTLSPDALRVAWYSLILNVFSSSENKETTTK